MSIAEAPLSDAEADLLFADLIDQSALVLAVSGGPDSTALMVLAGFATRRKMLRRALQGLVDESAFIAAGINPSARAEELDIEAWGRLACQ